MKTFLTSLAIAALVCTSTHAASSRLTQSLDGQWQIADSTSPTEIPTGFTRTVPVPGLANLAKPAFPDVDEFIRCEIPANRIQSFTSEIWKLSGGTLVRTTTPLARGFPVVLTRELIFSIRDIWHPPASCRQSRILAVDNLS